MRTLHPNSNSAKHPSVITNMTIILMNAFYVLIVLLISLNPFNASLRLSLLFLLLLTLLKILNPTCPALTTISTLAIQISLLIPLLTRSPITLPLLTNNRLPLLSLYLVLLPIIIHNGIHALSSRINPDSNASSPTHQSSNQYNFQPNRNPPAMHSNPQRPNAYYYTNCTLAYPESDASCSEPTLRTDIQNILYTFTADNILDTSNPPSPD